MDVREDVCERGVCWRVLQNWGNVVRRDMESILGTFPGKQGPWHFPKLVHTYVSC